MGSPILVQLKCKVGTDFNVKWQSHKPKTSKVTMRNLFFSAKMVSKGYNFCEVRIGTLTIHELWPPWKLMILKHGHGRGSKDLVEVTGEVDLKISGSKEIVLNKV